MLLLLFNTMRTRSGPPSTRATITMDECVLCERLVRRAERGVNVNETASAPHRHTISYHIIPWHTIPCVAPRSTARWSLRPLASQATWLYVCVVFVCPPRSTRQSGKVVARVQTRGW